MTQKEKEYLKQLELLKTLDDLEIQAIADAYYDKDIRGSINDKTR